ncbi:hypothetical protein QYE76_052107 [Lolium multiflorum]|uniref:F-box domain-containing protein n=1 Tax=Lolium multiflorum TaxID=4521 RepID=A0AAD8SUY2_LOLMU|nr:hypothetical protein QYE76_052107 [Lolium multiflorum]
MEQCDGDDRISTLPDDILVNILDRLNVREAARTSILSRRWSQLSAVLSQLTISARDFLRSKSSISDGELRRINAAVVKATKSILARRDPGGCTIRLLSTAFYLRDDVPISIGHTVGIAMATQKIENAEFTVWTVKERLYCTVDDMVNYGAQFVSFFNECLNAFAGLTRLHLENLRFAESDFVSNILGTCKQLKYLGFLNCDTESFIELQVEHAELSELSIVNCRFDKVNLKWLPRLTRTTFECWMSFEEPPLSLGHVPLLEVVSLTNVALSWHKMVNLSTLLFETSVRDLRLGFKCEKIWVQPECLTRRLASVFHRLRVVNLVNIPEGYDLTWTMFILEAAPSLEEFYMTVIDHPCEMQMDMEKRRARLYSERKGVEWVSPASNFKHHCLTKLIIFCFESKAYMVSHVRHVKKAAVNLKDVYLYNRLACRNCVRMRRIKPTRFPQSEKQRCSTKKLMTQGIEPLARIHFLNPVEMSADHNVRIL